MTLLNTRPSRTNVTALRSQTAPVRPADIRRSRQCARIRAHRRASRPPEPHHQDRSASHRDPCLTRLRESSAACPRALISWWNAHCRFGYAARMRTTDPARMRVPHPTGRVSLLPARTVFRRRFQHTRQNHRWPYSCARSAWSIRSAEQASNIPPFGGPPYVLRQPGMRVSSRPESTGPSRARYLVDIPRLECKRFCIFRLCQHKLQFVVKARHQPVR
jgi:hypothetical protein